MSKAIIFIITFLVYISRLGIIGSYATVKYSITNDLHVGETFLGIKHVIQEFLMLAIPFLGFSFDIHLPHSLNETQSSILFKFNFPAFYMLPNHVYH